MYKTLQLFTFSTSIFTSIKVIKKHINTDIKVIKTAKLIKAWVELKLLIVLCLMKIT